MPLILMDLIDDPDDNELYKEIYEQYQQLLFWQANGILHDEQKATDAVVETFLRLATIFQKTDKKICPRMKRLLVIINRNVAIDMQRKGSKETPVSPETVFAMADRASDDEPYRKAVIDEAVAALEKLPVKYRDVLYLSLVEDAGVKDIAAMLGVSEDAVYKRLERGKEMLHKEFDNDR